MAVAASFPAAGPRGTEGMTLVQWIVLALQASVALLVFALGLQAHYRDATYVFQRPGLLLRSLCSMSVVMPLFAVAAAVLTDLQPAIKTAIIALSVSPVPPILPRKQTKAGGTAPYAVGLLFSASVLAILLLPTVVELAGMLFGMEGAFAAGKDRADHARDDYPAAHCGHDGECAET